MRELRNDIMGVLRHPRETKPHHIDRIPLDQVEEIADEIMGIIAKHLHIEQEKIQ